MRKRGVKLLDTVALVQDIPSSKLKRGEVGTVVEILAPDVYEVEFCDNEGKPMPSWHYAAYKSSCYISRETL
jgi:hypothetical protein